MYSYADRIRAVELYIKLGLRPRRSYATRTVSGVPRLVNLLRMDARTCSSVTCRSK